MTPRRLAATFLTTLFLTALCLLATAHGARAEGSRDLYLSGTGNRGNIEWRTDTYGRMNYQGTYQGVKRRTLLRVYAVQGEYILVGSSAVGVANGGTTGDVYVYNPSSLPLSPQIGNEALPASPDFKASSQSGRGKIISRAQELAGPQSVSGAGGTGTYAPAYYLAPETGIYWVAIFGPSGFNTASDVSSGGGKLTGSIADTPGNYDADQDSTVAAWDVTVRAYTTSTTDETGRLFAYYLAINVGSNGRNLYCATHAVTTDGYQYKVSLNGLDPYGFILYSNQVGFLDPSGVPLYHDIVSASNSGQVGDPEGGCSSAPPQYPMFFSAAPASDALMTAGVSTTALVPSVGSLSFTGTSSGNARINQGGTFSFTCSLSATFQIVLSRDGVNFDPTLPGNRALNGLGTSSPFTVHWDGKDNSGVAFPVGTGYHAHLVVHAGEYHFPMLDAENSPNGGPSITLENATPALANVSYGFYDDRAYTTSAGSVNPYTETNPPHPDHSDAITGYDTSGTTRKWGDTSGSGFGNAKGLDLWTYTPVSPTDSTFNVLGPPHVLLVKRITAVNGADVTGFDDDPGTTDDNSAYWPAPAATYLRGTRSASAVKPGDEMEYTIYFLDTQGPATNVTLGDVLPAGTTFEANAFSAASGIGLALDASTLPTTPNSFLTNAADGDAGTFYAPGAAVPAAANPGGTPNTAGAVVVTLAPSPATLPAATGSGTPTNSYGFIRFKVHVN